MKTAHEIRATFQRMNDIVIPAGTPARWIEGGTGGWAVEPHHVTLVSDTAALFEHDSKFYYIWVNEKDLTQ